MDNRWAVFCARYEAASSDDRKRMLAGLSEEQRQAFTLNWTEFVATSGANAPAPPPPKKSLGCISGCLITAGIGILLMIILLIIGPIVDEWTETRKAEMTAQEEAAKEKEFLVNRTQILASIKEKIDQSDFKSASQISEKYKNIDDKDLVVLRKSAHEGVLLAKVKKIPANKTRENRDIYRELAALDPSNKKYKEKLAYYESQQKAAEAAEKAKKQKEAAELKKIQTERDARVRKFGEPPIQSSWDGSYLPVTSYLKKIANDPKSIDIDGCTEVYYTTEGWLVGCNYRGKNAFGGLVLQSNWFLIVHDEVVEMKPKGAYTDP